ncbi:hypothetical protein [Asaia bogorensis]|uniref:hypothetical protein n=1 Tax=Asaia bogorensis TaxID=91915 RepID=UPI003016801F
MSYEDNISVENYSNIDDRYLVIPLDYNKEGDGYYVGNRYLNEYYLIPEEGVQLLIKLTECGALSKLYEDKSIILDNASVLEFIDEMVAIGFVYKSECEALYHDVIANIYKIDKALSPSKLEMFLTKYLYIRWSIFAYCVVGCVTCYELWNNPKLRPRSTDLFFPHDLSAHLIVLLLLGFIVAMAHECAHLFAARRAGVATTMGFGNRMWHLVALVDMSGLWSISRPKRYLPLMAGMLSDGLIFCLSTIFLNFAIKFKISLFLESTLYALQFQILLGVAWQFSVFMKTDVYFILCNFFQNPNLEKNSLTLYKKMISGIWENNIPVSEWIASCKTNLPSLIYGAFWVFGRIWALYTLVFLILPILYKYFTLSISVVRDSRHSLYEKADAIVFVVLCLSPIIVGMFLWIKNSIRREHDEYLRASVQK